jgi:hypothetical protein
VAHLTLTVDFTIGEGAEIDRFELGGTLREDAAYDVISAWLLSQMGTGPDGSDPNKKQTYHIEIDWDPSDDRLVCRSDCGHKGLRDGLLLYIQKKLAL